jgi:hypothetical protein
VWLDHALLAEIAECAVVRSVACHGRYAAAGGGVEQRRQPFERYEEVITDAAGIRRVDEREQAMLDHIDDKVRLGLPPAVQSGLARMRTGSNPLHRDGLVAALAEFVQDRVEDGPLECFPAASERVVSRRDVGRMRGVSAHPLPPY